MNFYCVITERCGVYTPHFFNSFPDAKYYALHTPYDWALHLAGWVRGELVTEKDPLYKPLWVDEEDTDNLNRLEKELEA